MEALRFLPAALLIATIASAEDGTLAPSSSERRAAVLAGFGNPMGWLGIQAETYFANGRGSAFAGLGYTPSSQRSWSGAAFAAGARVFTSGQKHRLYLEASFSQLAVEHPANDSQPKGDERVYGPGLQLGYQLVKRSGFTFVVSAGVGHTVGGPSHLQGTMGMLALGMGHTWLPR